MLRNTAELYTEQGRFTYGPDGLKAWNKSDDTLRSHFSHDDTEFFMCSEISGGGSISLCELGSNGFVAFKPEGDVVRMHSLLLSDRAPKKVLVSKVFESPPSFRVLKHYRILNPPLDDEPHVLYIAMPSVLDKTAKDVMVLSIEMCVKAGEVTSFSNSLLPISNTPHHFETLHRFTWQYGSEIFMAELATRPDELLLLRRWNKNTLEAGATNVLQVIDETGGRTLSKVLHGLRKCEDETSEMTLKVFPYTCSTEILRVVLMTPSTVILAKMQLESKTAMLTEVYSCEGHRSAVARDKILHLKPIGIELVVPRSRRSRDAEFRELGSGRYIQPQISVSSFCNDKTSESEGVSDLSLDDEEQDEKEEESVKEEEDPPTPSVADSTKRPTFY